MGLIECQAFENGSRNDLVICFEQTIEDYPKSKDANIVTGIKNYFKYLISLSEKGGQK